MKFYSLLLLLLIVATGCGRSGPEVVPIDGTITLGGGQWPKPGVLYFTASSPAAGMPGRPALGAFGIDGRLTVTTFKKGDGLIPGTYKIAVECWDIPPQMGGPPPKSYVPQRFQSPATSGLTVVVESGQRNVSVNLDVAKH